MSKHLQKLYGDKGISMIVDEGGMGLDRLYGKDFALPGVAEKGHLVRSSLIIPVILLSELTFSTRRTRKSELI